MKIQQFPKLAHFLAGSLYNNSLPSAALALKKAQEYDCVGGEKALEDSLSQFSPLDLWEAGKQADDGVEDSRLPENIYRWLDNWY